MTGVGNARSITDVREGCSSSCFKSHQRVVLLASFLQHGVVFSSCPPVGLACCRRPAALTHATLPFRLPCYPCPSACCPPRYGEPTCHALYVPCSETSGPGAQPPGRLKGMHATAAEYQVGLLMGMCVHAHVFAEAECSCMSACLQRCQLLTLHLTLL